MGSMTQQRQRFTAILLLTICISAAGEISSTVGQAKYSIRYRLAQGQLQAAITTFGKIKMINTHQDLVPMLGPVKRSHAPSPMLEISKDKSAGRKLEVIENA